MCVWAKEKEKEGLKKRALVHSPHTTESEKKKEGTVLVS
jgi:hypothetical protein